MNHIEKQNEIFQTLCEMIESDGTQCAMKDSTDKVRKYFRSLIKKYKKDLVFGYQSESLEKDLCKRYSIPFSYGPDGPMC